jgi:hypothetical protein
MIYDLLYRPAFDPNTGLTAVEGVVGLGYNDALLSALTYADERGLTMVPLNPHYTKSLHGCTQGWALYDGEISALNKVGLLGIAEGQTVLGTSSEKSEDTPITTV